MPELRKISYTIIIPIYLYRNQNSALPPRRADNITVMQGKNPQSIQPQNSSHSRLAALSHGHSRASGYRAW